MRVVGPTLVTPLGRFGAPSNIDTEARESQLLGGVGQLDAGFLLAGFYEDRDPAHPLARFLPTFIATRAVKPG